MAELSAESRMNTAALKRADPYLKELLETAAHVALYTFNANVNEWEKTDVEGALFVYSRTGEPFHNILIMNRLNSKNFVEPVIRGLDLHLEDPYLLYRTVKGCIYCVWFYDKGECSRIGHALAKLVRETFIATTMDKTVSNRKSGGGVDIFSMLSKAQEEYNSAAAKDSNKSSEDNTPKSVKDFFMKASSSSAWASAQQKTSEVGGLVKAGGVVSCRQMMPAAPPPPGLDPLPPNKPPAFPVFGKLVLDAQNVEKLQQKTATQPRKDSSKKETVSKSSARIQNGGGIVSPTTSVVQTLNFFNSNLTKSFQKLQTADEPPKLPTPAMPPQPAMFTNSKITAPKPPQPAQTKVDPLTKSQLIKAVDYLLTNDPDFIHQIHEAYVKSLKS